jgi:hypothetical protein
MRAIKRTFLAPLLLLAALAVVFAAHLTPGTGHGGGADAACPIGTNWDFVTHTCH